MRSGVKRSGGQTSSIAVIVGHPLRLRCWTILDERTASPNQLAKMLKEDLGNVAYHVRVLEKAGCIELLDTRPRRGSVEHIYRSILRPAASDADTAARTPSQRIDFARYIGQRALADYELALVSGTFGKRPDHCAWRLPMTIDEAGWRELNAIYAEVTDRIMEVQVNAAGRRAEGSGEAIAVTAAAFFFETPQRLGEGDRSSDDQ